MSLFVRVSPQSTATCPGLTGVLLYCQCPGPARRLPRAAPHSLTASARAPALLAAGPQPRQRQPHCSTQRRSGATPGTPGRAAAAASAPPAHSQDGGTGTASTAPL